MNKNVNLLLLMFLATILGILLIRPISVPDQKMKFINSLPLETGSNPCWKRYINSQQGYSIEFPASYTTDTIIANELQLCNKESESQRTDPMANSKNDLCISIAGPKDITLSGQHKNLREYIQKSSSMDSGIIENNIVYRQMNGQEVAIESNDRYYFFYNGYIYIIDKKSRGPNFDQEFNEILSTFKFTN